MSRRSRDERGAVMIEFVIIATFLFLLFSAVIDLGLAWRRSNDVASTLRSATRVEAGIGNDGAADFQSLFTLNAGVAEIGSANVKRVIVFKASESDGAVPDECLDVTPSATGAGVDSGTVQCNVYSPEQLEALSSAAFTPSGATTCPPSAWDRWYCPAEREDRQSEGADFVGVWMEVDYRYVVGALPGNGLTIHDKAIMRIEPVPT